MAKAKAPAKPKQRQGKGAREDRRQMRAARDRLARARAVLIEARRTNRTADLRAAAADVEKADAAIKTLNRARFKKLVDQRGLAALRATDFLCKLFGQSRYSAILTDADEAAIVGALQEKVDAARGAFKASRDRQKAAKGSDATAAPVSLFTGGDNASL